jgi:hypothetical protein
MAVDVVESRVVGSVSSRLMRQTVTDKIWLCIVEHYCLSWWASADAGVRV